MLHICRISIVYMTYFYTPKYYNYTQFKRGIDLYKLQFILEMEFYL